MKLEMIVNGFVDVKVLPFLDCRLRLSLLLLHYDRAVSIGIRSEYLLALPQFVIQCAKSFTPMTITDITP